MQVDGLFLFTASLGADYTGTWTTNATFAVTITDATGHAMSSSTRFFSLQCLQPIRDAALVLLPSTCDSYGSQFVGDFGLLLSPALVSAIAADEDNLDGILSAGDIIDVRWSRTTDMSVQGGAGCPDNAVAARVALSSEELYQMVLIRVSGESGLSNVDVEYEGAPSSALHFHLGSPICLCGARFAHSIFY